MTAPGDFSSGDVLTAADMNALPAGELGELEAGDVTVGTSLVDVGNLSFTLPSSRRILITAQVNQIDSVSADMTVTLNVQNTNAAGTPTEEYLQFAQTCQNGFNNSTFGSQIVTLAAGSHTLYFVASTTTGTCRFNFISSLGSYNCLMAIDLGAS